MCEEETKVPAIHNEIAIKVCCRTCSPLAEEDPKIGAIHLPVAIQVTQARGLPPKGSHVRCALNPPRLLIAVPRQRFRKGVVVVDIDGIDADLGRVRRVDQLRKGDQVKIAGRLIDEVRVDVYVPRVVGGGVDTRDTGIGEREGSLCEVTLLVKVAA